MNMRTKKGAVGIGTLIIFIAMVLVAAIAAAVLINVSGILQQRAMATGKEAIAQVSGNIVIVSVMANTDATRSDLDSMNLTITAAAGAGRVDLSQMIVKIGNNVNQTTLNYSSVGASATAFDIYAVRDPSALFSLTTPVIDGSSLVGVNINMAAHVPRPNFPVRTQYHIELIPEHGATTTIDGVTPATYSTSLQVLYP